MAMILAGLAAEPAIWRLAAPLAAARPVTLPGHVLRQAKAGPWAWACPGDGEIAALALEPAPQEAAALGFLLTSLGLGLRGQVWCGEGEGEAPALGPEVREVLVALCQDILALRDSVPPEAIATRLGPMLVRAASRLRAQKPRQSRLRHVTQGADVALTAKRLPYAKFFAMEEFDIAWRRFDGTMSAGATRAAFISGDAVTVLPYDPIRDRVLVIEQFRAGPLARGDQELWQIEAIAGRIDPFETPQEAARREAVEEAGLVLTDLRFVARYYPSPGALSEYIYSYVALTDLPDGSAGVFGLAEEAEDIRGHLLEFEAFMDLVASGEVDNAPLALTALWLQRERGRLRAPG